MNQHTTVEMAALKLQPETRIRYAKKTSPFRIWYVISGLWDAVAAAFGPVQYANKERKMLVNEKLKRICFEMFRGWSWTFWTAVTLNELPARRRVKRAPWSSEDDLSITRRCVRTCQGSRNSQEIRCIGPRRSMELPSSWCSCVCFCITEEMLREHLLGPTRMATDVHRTLRHESSAAVFTLGGLCLRCVCRCDNGGWWRNEQPFIGKNQLIPSNLFTVQF